jgi:hypothetical protein
MTIAEYRAKLQADLEKASSEKAYYTCRELLGTLELLDGLPPDAPARFLTFTEIVQINETGTELAAELEKEQRIHTDEHFRVLYKFYALAEAYKLRGEKKPLFAIADSIRSALPRPIPPAGAKTSSVMTIAEYRAKIKADLKKATAETERSYQAADLSAMLELIPNVKDDAPAQFLNFSDIVLIGPAAHDLAAELYKNGEITSNQRWQVIHRFFAVAEVFTLRDEPLSLEKISTTVKSQLEEEGWLD